MRLPQPAEARRSVREPVVLAGSAFGVARSRSVMISDISFEGAQLEARDLPPAGETLCLVAGSLDTLARVAWQTAERCGIEFESPLTDGIVAQLKRDAQWISVAGWYR